MGSVLRDHGTAKAVVHPDGSDVHVLTDIVAARDGDGRCRAHNIGAAHEQVVVSRAHGATPTGVARLIELDTGCGHITAFARKSNPRLAQPFRKPVAEISRMDLRYWTYDGSALAKALAVPYEASAVHQQCGRLSLA